MSHNRSTDRFTDNETHPGGGGANLVQRRVPERVDDYPRSACARTRAHHRGELTVPGQSVRRCKHNWPKLRR